MRTVLSSGYTCALWRAGVEWPGGEEGLSQQGMWEGLEVAGMMLLEVSQDQSLVKD